MCLFLMAVGGISGVDVTSVPFPAFFLTEVWIFRPIVLCALCGAVFSGRYASYYSRHNQGHVERASNCRSYLVRNPSLFNQ